LEWFESLPQKARLACIARIELLKARGHELRRPHADYLRDDIYELRAKHQGVNYRLLYFFHGQGAVGPVPWGSEAAGDGAADRH
jgi:hypothetical protein